MTKKKLPKHLPRFCPVCERSYPDIKINRISNLWLHNMDGTEIYTVDHAWMCTGCRQTWTTGGDDDPLPLLYNEFKVRTGKKWRGRAGRQKCAVKLVASFHSKEYED